MTLLIPGSSENPAIDPDKVFIAAEATSTLPLTHERIVETIYMLPDGSLRQRTYQVVSQLQHDESCPMFFLSELGFDTADLNEFNLWKEAHNAL